MVKELGKKFSEEEKGGESNNLHEKLHDIIGEKKSESHSF